MTKADKCGCRVCECRNAAEDGRLLCRLCRRGWHKGQWMSERQLFAAYGVPYRSRVDAE